MSNKWWLPCAAVALSAQLGCAAMGAGKRGPPAPLEEPVTGMEFVRVEGGCYPMGNPFETGGPEEQPVHEVCVKSFYMGKYEVTQAQWKALMGANPSSSPTCGDGCPVDNVSWNDAQAFLERLNARSGRAAGSPDAFRLPTEAEWEYAARSGGKREMYAGSADHNIDAFAWYTYNAGEIAQVGLKAPNGLGLHDMSGNVWEMTGDRWDDRYYAASPRDDPAGPATGEHRVVRGGSVADDSFEVRTFYRNHLPPDYRGRAKGFRVVSRTRPGR